jgi:hypothetical protein
MASFEAKEIKVANINGGNEYESGDTLQVEALNEIIEGILHISNFLDTLTNAEGVAF